MRRQYFVRFGDFANVYDLAWSDSKCDTAFLLEHGFEQTTLKEALQLARRESDRRKYDQAFSGYANTEIYPAKYFTMAVYDDIPENLLYHNYELHGRIWE